MSSVSTLSLALVGLFFSEIILDICELILFLPGFHVVMQCNDAITCVLASPSFLPFQGNQVQGNSILEKKCVREMTVEVRFFSGHPGCYLGNSRDFPYNRNDAILIPFLLSRLLAPPRGGKLQDCLILVCL